MAFSNYYLANDLSGIGAQMQQDRGLQAQVQMAQAEQKRLAYAQFMQQLQAQQAQAQQAQQFQQELAMRQHGQGQENAYREALLGLRRSDSNRDDTYRYAALDNAIKQIEAQANVPDSRLGVAQANQQGITQRDMEAADEVWNQNNSLSKGKASRWTGRINQMIKNIGEEEKERAGAYMGFASDKKAAAWAKAELNKKLEDIQGLIDADQSPGSIEPIDMMDISKGFKASDIPRPYQSRFQKTQGPYNPVGQPPPEYLSTDFAPRSTRMGPSSAAAAVAKALAGGTITSTQPPPAESTYQSELAQIQAAGRAGLLDRASYARMRRELDAKYGIIQR